MNMHWIKIAMGAAALWAALATAAPAGGRVNSWIFEEQSALTADGVELIGEGDWMIVRGGEKGPADVRRELAAGGWSVAAFVPRDGWLARVDDAAAARRWMREFTMKAKDAIKSAAIIPMPAEMKIERGLWEACQAGGIAPDDKLALIVYYIGEGLGLRAAIEGAGGIVASEPASAAKQRLGVKVRGARLGEFLVRVTAHPDVYSIQPGAGARLLNDNASRIIQSGSAASGAMPIWARELRGEGQVIAVLDTGLDFDSCFFAEDDASSPPLALGTAVGAPDATRRKVIIYDLLFSGDWDAGANDFDNQGHGTAVAGNALGSRLALPFDGTVNNGMASAAQLIVQDAGFTGFDDCADLIALQCPVVDLTPFLDQAIAQGAHIHNNSWGDRENFTPQNTYTAPTADMDDAVWRNPEFVIVCAAGNSGASGINTVGSPSVGKNVISAAATQSPSAGGSEENITSFSARGWASDERIKPDLAAPGQTFSARGDGSIATGNCSTQIIQGTSMASPVTAGAAALVRQYFSQGWYPSGAKVAGDGFTPTAALIKAALLNGAANMTGVAGSPPNRAEGWGRVHLENSLFFSGDARRVIAADERDCFPAGASGAAAEWRMTVAAGGNAAAGDIRITLVWTDYPASPAAMPALVNDLDLIVRDTATGGDYRGNNLDVITGLSSLGGAADQINNVEMVALPGMFAGELEIRVEASLIVEGPQGFAVVVGGDVTEAAPSVATDWWIYLH